MDQPCPALHTLDSFPSFQLWPYSTNSSSVSENLLSPNILETRDDDAEEFPIPVTVSIEPDCGEFKGFPRWMEEISMKMGPNSNLERHIPIYGLSIDYIPAAAPISPDDPQWHYRSFPTPSQESYNCLLTPILSPAPCDSDPGNYRYPISTTYHLRTDKRYSAGCCYYSSYNPAFREKDSKTLASIISPPGTKPAGYDLAHRRFIMQDIEGMCNMPPGIPFAVALDGNLSRWVTVACAHTLESLERTTSAADFVSIKHGVSVVNNVTWGAKGQGSIFSLDGLKRNLRSGVPDDPASNDGSYSLASTLEEGSSPGVVVPAVQANSPIAKERLTLLLEALGLLYSLVVPACVTRLEWILTSFRDADMNVYSVGSIRHIAATGVQLNGSSDWGGGEIRSIGPVQNKWHTDKHDHFARWTLLLLSFFMPPGSDMGAFLLGRLGLYCRYDIGSDGRLTLFILFKGNDIHAGNAPSIDPTERQKFFDDVSDLFDTVPPQNRAAYVMYPNAPAVDRTAPVNATAAAGFMNDHVYASKSQYSSFSEHGSPALGHRPAVVERITRDRFFEFYNYMAQLHMRPSWSHILPESGFSPLPFDPFYDACKVYRLRVLYKRLHLDAAAYALYLTKSQIIKAASKAAALTSAVASSKGVSKSGSLMGYPALRYKRCSELESLPPLKRPRLSDNALFASETSHAPVEPFSPILLATAPLHNDEAAPSLQSRTKSLPLSSQPGSAAVDSTSSGMFRLSPGQEVARNSVSDIPSPSRSSGCEQTANVPASPRATSLVPGLSHSILLTESGKTTQTANADLQKPSDSELTATQCPYVELLVAQSASVYMNNSLPTSVTVPPPSLSSIPTTESQATLVDCLGSPKPPSVPPSPEPYSAQQISQAISTSVPSFPIASSSPALSPAFSTTSPSIVVQQDRTAIATLTTTDLISSSTPAIPSLSSPPGISFAGSLMQSVSAGDKSRPTCSTYLRDLGLPVTISESRASSYPSTEPGFESHSAGEAGVGLDVILRLHHRDYSSTFRSSPATEPYLDCSASAVSFSTRNTPSLEYAPLSGSGPTTPSVPLDTTDQEILELGSPMVSTPTSTSILLDTALSISTDPRFRRTPEPACGSRGTGEILTDLNYTPPLHHRDKSLPPFPSLRPELHPDVSLPVVPVATLETSLLEVPSLVRSGLPIPPVPQDTTDQEILKLGSPMVPTPAYPSMSLDIELPIGTDSGSYPAYEPACRSHEVEGVTTGLDGASLSGRLDCSHPVSTSSEPEPHPDVVSDDSLLDASNEYEVSLILAEDTTKKLFKVRWRGYRESDDSWVREDDLSAAELVAEFRLSFQSTLRKAAEDKLSTSFSLNAICGVLNPDLLKKQIENMKETQKRLKAKRTVYMDNVPSLLDESSTLQFLGTTERDDWIFDDDHQFRILRGLDAAFQSYSNSQLALDEMAVVEYALNLSLCRSLLFIYYWATCYGPEIAAHLFSIQSFDILKEDHPGWAPLVVAVRKFIESDKCADRKAANRIFRVAANSDVWTSMLCNDVTGRAFECYAPYVPKSASTDERFRSCSELFTTFVSINSMSPKMIRILGNIRSRKRSKGSGASDVIDSRHMEYDECLVRGCALSHLIDTVDFDGIFCASSIKAFIVDPWRIVNTSKCKQLAKEIRDNPENALSDFRSWLKLRDHSDLGKIQELSHELLDVVGDCLQRMQKIRLSPLSGRPRRCKPFRRLSQFNGPRVDSRQPLADLFPRDGLNEFGIISVILKEVLRFAQNLPEYNNALRRILDGKHPFTSSSTSHEPDHFNPLRHANQQHILLTDTLSLQESNIQAAWGLSNLLLRLGTGQGGPTAAFQKKYLNRWFDSASKAVDAFEAGQRDGLEISNGAIWGTFCAQLSLQGCNISERIGSFFSDSVVQAWKAFYLDNDTASLKSWSQARGLVTQIAGFGPKSLTSLQLANTLALLGYCERPTVPEMGEAIALLNRGGLAGLRVLGCEVDSKDIGAVTEAFKCVYCWVDHHLSDNNKRMLDFGSIFLEHLLCKIQRWKHKLSSGRADDYLELLRVKAAESGNTADFPLPLKADRLELERLRKTP